MLFRVLVFILLVALGYYYSRKIQGSRLSMALVSTLLVLLLAVFFVFGKKLWAMFGFSMYLMIIVLGFAAGILAGLGSRAKKTGTGGPRCSSEETIGKNGLEPEHPDHP